MQHQARALSSSLGLFFASPAAKSFKTAVLQVRKGHQPSRSVFSSSRRIISNKIGYNGKQQMTTTSVPTTPSHAAVRHAQKEEQAWSRQSSSRDLLHAILSSPIDTTSDKYPLQFNNWSSFFERRYPEQNGIIAQDSIAMRILSNVNTFPLSLSFGLNNIFQFGKLRDQIQVYRHPTHISHMSSHINWLKTCKNQTQIFIFKQKRPYMTT